MFISAYVLIDLHSNKIFDLNTNSHFVKPKN